MSQQRPRAISFRRQPEYVPTPPEIAKACAVIRAAWTPRERARRFVGPAYQHTDELWHPPVISTTALGTPVGKPMLDLVS